MNMAVFRYVAPRNLVESFQHFERMLFLCLQNIFVLSSETLVNFCHATRRQERLNNRRTPCRFPALARGSLFTGTSRPVLLFSGFRGLFPLEESGSEREASHLPPSSTEVKNEWRCASTTTCIFTVFSGTALPLPLLLPCSTLPIPKLFAATPRGAA